LQVSGLSQAVSDELPHAVPPCAGLPLVQAPDWQVSLVVHGLPSLQVLPFGALADTQPVSVWRPVVSNAAFPVSVPLFAYPALSPAFVPEPSSRPHLPMSRAAGFEASARMVLFIAFRICEAVRA